MERISIGRFESEDGLHKVSYSKYSGYVSCSCPYFEFFGKCVATDEVKEILKGEGRKVSLRRVIKPAFLQDLKNFQQRISSVLTDSYREK